MTATTSKLGKGLDALISESDFNEEIGEVSNENIQLIDLERIKAGKYQPRKEFDEEKLAELAASVKSQGVIQPILLRRLKTVSEFYEIIAGERRFRAAKQAGLKEIPAIIREFSDAEALEIGILENVQREDLKPIEEAKAYLLSFGVTESSVEIWGTGQPRREFLWSKDMADACVFLMENNDK